MEIRTNQDICIIAPICKKIDSFKSNLILEKIKKETRRIALDLTYVQECTIDFIEALINLQQNELGIFNIPADIFVLFNIMNVDKSIKLYVSEIDFETNSHQIINRKFVFV